MSLELIAPDGTHLDLMPGTKIQLNLANSAFDEQVLRGSFSYSFTLPLTDKNRIFFGFPEQISSNAGYVTDYDGFKLKSGLVEFLCRLKVQSVGIESIKINLFTGTGLFSEFLKTRKLRDLDFGTSTIDIPPLVNDIIVRIASFDTITFDELTLSVESAGVYWKHGYRDINGVTRQRALQKLCERINEPKRLVPIWNNSESYIAYKSWVVKGLYIYQAVEDNTNADPETPPGDEKWQQLGLASNFESIRNSQTYDYWWFYDLPDDPKDYTVFPCLGHLVMSRNRTLSPGVLPLLNSIIDNPGIDLIFPVLEFMYLNSLADPRTGDIKFFPVRNDSFSSDYPYVPVINRYKDGGFVNEAIMENDGIINPISPMLRVLFIFEKIFEILGIRINDENVFSNDFLKCLVAFSNFSAEKILAPSKSNFFPNVLKLNEFTPDVSISDFINGFRTMFFVGSWFDFFQKEIKFKPLKDVLVDFENAIDLTDLVSNFDDIFYENPDGYRLYFSHDSGDEIASSEIKILSEEDITVLEPVANIAALPDDDDVNVVRLVESEDKFYISSKNESGDLLWNYFALNYQDFKIGNGSTVYTAKAAGLPNFIGSDGREAPLNYDLVTFNPVGPVTSGTYATNGSATKRAIYLVSSNSFSDRTKWEPMDPIRCLLPYAGIEGRSSYYRKNSSCELRFIPYVGLQANPENNDPDDTYPLACNDPYERLGQIYPGRGGSLKWEGEYGIYNQWGKEWLDFKANAKSASVSVIASETLLNKLKPWLLVKIRNHYFLWSEMKVSLPLGQDLLTLRIHKI
jgi:hypothetical protein